MSKFGIDSPIESSTLIETLLRDGYVFIPKWRQGLAPAEFLATMERYVDCRAHTFGSETSSIQILTPRTAINKNRRRYSDIYGLGEFPLHTDLAHWARPPRYIMLRCVAGCTDVYTSLLPVSFLNTIVDKSMLLQAMFCSEPLRRDHSGSILPMIFTDNNVNGLRWDQHSLKPMNTAAFAVGQSMSITESKHSEMSVQYLADIGDTLIIDNWRCLHGRGRVSKEGQHRRIQRIYLSEVEDV